MPQLDPYWVLSQVFWLFLSFITLYFVMKQAGLPRLGNLLQDRRERIEGDLETADAARLQSESIDHQNQVQIKAARGRASEIISEMLKESEAFAAERNADLDKVLQQKMAEAQVSIEKAKKEVLDRIAPMSVELTQAMLKRVLGVDLPKDKIEKAVAGQMRGKHV